MDKAYRDLIAKGQADDKEPEYSILKKGLHIKYDISELQLRRIYEKYDWDLLYQSYQVAILSLDPSTRDSPRWIEFEKLLDEMTDHPYITRLYGKNDTKETRSRLYKLALNKIKL